MVFNGFEVSAGEDENFLEIVAVAAHVNVLNATELFT